MEGNLYKTYFFERNVSVAKLFLSIYGGKNPSVSRNNLPPPLEFFARFLKINSISRSIRPSWTLFATKIRPVCYAMTEIKKSKFSHFWPFWRLFSKFSKDFQTVEQYWALTEHGYNIFSKLEPKKTWFYELRIAKNYF